MGKTQLRSVSLFKSSYRFGGERKGSARGSPVSLRSAATLSFSRTQRIDNQWPHTAVKIYFGTIASLTDCGLAVRKRERNKAIGFVDASKWVCDWAGDAMGHNIALRYEVMRTDRPRGLGVNANINRGHECSVRE